MCQYRENSLVSISHRFKMMSISTKPVKLSVLQNMEYFITVFNQSLKSKKVFRLNIPNRK